MTRAYTANASGSIISSVYYDYNNDTGKIESTTNVNGTETIEYDSLGRIKKETHADGTYKKIDYDCPKHQRAENISNTHMTEQEKY